MYGLTRATTTLLAVAVAALLLWLGVQVIEPVDEGGGPSTREYWTFMGLLAAAGFVIALSQLLGGWTKWGWPRLSLMVFLLGFLPAAIVGFWLLAFHQPGDNGLEEQIRDWSDDLGIESTFAELGLVASVVAFGLGLLLGLTFDTTGPRTRATVVEEPADAPTIAGAGYRPSYDERERVVREEPAPERRYDEETRTSPEHVERDDTRVIRPDRDPDTPPPRREP